MKSFESLASGCIQLFIQAPGSCAGLTAMNSLVWLIRARVRSNAQSCCSTLSPPYELLTAHRLPGAFCSRPALVLHARDLEMWHGRSCKQPLAGFCQPAGPTRRARDSCTVGGDSRVCIHLPVNFRDQDESEAGPQRLYKPGTHPNGPKTIEIFPD